MEVRVADAEEMAREAARAVAAIPASRERATVIALSGELGAGKTTFAQAAARFLGVEERVASPTFVIEKIYQLSGKPWKRLVHIDAYRLREANELRALGWDELVRDPNNLILIEWPERVSELIPPSAVRAAISPGDGEARIISYGG